MTPIERIQNWYVSHCNCDWEHSYGISIDTLDNPGWCVKIDLIGTELDGKDFPSIKRGDSESDSDRLHAKVEDQKFQGACGVHCLDETLETFLIWADC